ncbi:MAG: redoxin domain-containing protein [Prevotellaceae bacterium]|jgi:hypothetical protein|nr:redoxin domain-containing protein [Prevotellaceae bacterium]
MKKTFLFLAMLIFVQILFAQISLDSIWQQQVIEKYKKMDNYTIQVTTNATIRGKYINPLVGNIDTIYQKKDLFLLHIERQNGKMIFSGIENNGDISYTQNDTNITAGNYRGIEYIAINPLSNNVGTYFNDVSFDFPAQFVRSIIDRGQNFKKIDGIYDCGDYFVFECVDTLISINDIQMYENVKMFVNKNNYLLEKITTKRQNNTVAELGLGAIEREITINYLEINQKQSLYRALFNTKEFADYQVIKNEFPWSSALIKREKQNKKWENSSMTLSKSIMQSELVDLEGNTTSLDKIDGWILVDTWYQNCYPCFEMMKQNTQNHSEFEKMNIKIVALNTFDQPNNYLVEFCTKQGVTLDELYFLPFDADLQEFKKVFKIFPSLFLISPDKKVVWKSVGIKAIDEIILSKIDKAINNYNKNKNQ